MNVRFGDEVIPVSGGVMPARSPAGTITAEIPYLRSELHSVQVEFEDRDPRRPDRRAASDAGPRRSNRSGPAVVGT